MMFPYQEIYANILLYKSHAKFSGTLMKSITTEEEVAMNHTLNDDVNVELEYELIKMERKRNKLIFAAMIIGMALIAALAVFAKQYSSTKQKYEETIAELEAEINSMSEPVAVYEEATKQVDINAINTEIQDIGELATVEYLYTDAGKFEDPKQLFGKNVPFTTKSFIAKWDGSIKAGVEISEVTAEVDKDNKEIVIHMPKARILSHQIDKDSIETLDQKDGLFNPVKVEDVRNFDSVSQDAMEERAIENGILDKAFENAKNIIRKIIDNDLVEELGYTVCFETIE